MTHELILTSVARGLDPKDRGFCPVAVDSRISPQVVQTLTTLSGYRYLVTESGDLFLRSPVAYSHLILPGGSEHVLSRVAGAGTDWQGQPNALAHHIVLKREERSVESPAWLLALPGFHLSEWNEPPIRFTCGRPIPTLTNPPSLTRRQQIARQCRWLDPMKMALTSSVDIDTTAYSFNGNEEQIALAAPPTTPCPTWKESMGDPGWGGVLAETVFTGQPIVLIYNPGQNILPLFVEALALLPEQTAWQTTFCTYFMGFPDDILCQWKGVVADSEEAALLTKDANNLIIDLTAPKEEAPPGKYVDYARFGQEHMLPQDIEECASTIITTSAETKSHSDIAEQKTDKLYIVPGSMPTKVHVPVPPKIQLPKKHNSPLESLLRRSSRFQFYLLYSIMFALVLFLLVLAVDQAGNFGIVEVLRNWNQQTALVPPDIQESEPEPEITSELDAPAEAVPEHIEQETVIASNNLRKIFETHKAEQRESLLQFLASFNVPEFLAIHFPDMQDFQIDVPEKKTFAELSPLHGFGMALELRFIPLFELPTMRVETSLVLESLPDLVWRVSAVEIETGIATPMFLFRLTEAGLEMDWQHEGLTHQYLYDTILSSLGFLQLSVADMPETAKLIPLLVPVEAEPMKVSDLANLSEQDPPEHAIDLPFASELWQAIFATMKPPFILHLEVLAEPVGDWTQTESPSTSEFQAVVHTGQQAKKTGESGDTFENIVVLFVSEASLERIVWKGDAYAERLRAEQETIRLEREDLTSHVDQLRTQAFEGNENAKQELDEHKAKPQALKYRLDVIESILEKLPAAYKELSENESGRFHYSVFLESESTNRQLLILRTVP